MLIRREDFGDIEELTKGSHRKIWMICDECGIGVLKKYCFYLRQKYGDLCQNCVNKLITNTPEFKEKLSKSTKKVFENDEYRKKHSERIKKAWTNEEYKRKQSESSKKRWRRKSFKENHIKCVKNAWEYGKYKNLIKVNKELFENDEYRKKHGERLKKIFSDEKYDFRLDEKELEKRCKRNGFKYRGRKKINGKTYIIVECKHGHITEKAISTIENSGCKTCSHIVSLSEKDLSEYIKSLNIDIIENNRSIINPFELDIVIPSYKLSIEYCGLYWHSEKKKNKYYHLKKLIKANKAGYRLITIFEDEWLYKQDIVKNRLKYFLGLNTKRIYARKCEIREISKEQAREFIDKHHIQGFTSASIYLGAFYKEKLVAVNTFVNRKNIWELNRFCVNSSIIGIASKFIKYFKRNYEWKKIITFADLRWSEGSLYETIGFTKDKVLKPDYSYFNKREMIRYHKFNFRHSGMKNKLENYNSELSERENMKNNNYLRIYDCGKIRYIMKNSNQYS